MSEVSERNSRGLIQQEEDIRMEESMSTEWTNEKHCLYLNSMEAMFVKQLYSNQYNAMDSGWRSRSQKQPNTSSSGESSAKPQTSVKVKVLQSGCRKNVHVMGTLPGLDSDESCALVDTAWSSYNQEVSDQNFVDKEDEPIKRNHVSKKKRMKEKVSSDDTTKDQVVPTSESPTPKNLSMLYEEKESNCTNLQLTSSAEGGIL